VKNEEETIRTLFERIQAEIAVQAAVESYEVIYIDDGSTDGSWQQIAELAAAQPGTAVGFRLRRNFGKAVALAVGFQHSRGEVVFTLDGDLQDDPAEIPRFLEKLAEGYDLVSGWKQHRQDPISKTAPSKLFNWVTAKLSGIPLHDFNCGFKAYRSEVLRDLRIYGELHRYIPVLAHDLGFRIAEVSVRHHPRLHGVSKYGLERYARGMLDLLTVLATTRYLQKPAHLFGGLGILLGLAGTIILLYLTGLWFVGYHIGERPLLLLGILLEIVAVQFVALGLLGELFIRQLGAPLRDSYVAEIAEGPITPPR
jgi:glycosyltransferase involved in cell wall biosynthesis